MHKVEKSTKITLLLIAMLGVMSNTAIVTSLPHLGEHFKNTPHIELLSRLMITLPSLVIAILAPFLGHFIYKTSIIKNAIFALILFAIAGSAGLYLQDINSLLISRMFLGLAIAIIMIVGTTLTGFYFHGNARDKFMGLQSAFISIGGVLFITGGGMLSDIQWRYPFGIYLIGLIILPMVVLFLKEPSSLSELEDDRELPSNVRFIYVLAFILMLIFYVLPTQMPFLMINHFGASGTLAGLIISSAMASNALGAISFAKFKKYFSFADIWIIGLIILAIGFIGIGNITNVYFFFFTSPIMGFGGGLLMTATMAWMLEIVHHTRRTKASGYLTGAFFGGQFASPIVFYPIVTYFGLQHFFIILGVTIFVITFSFVLYKKIKK
jgi:MFS family permease